MSQHNIIVVGASCAGKSTFISEALLPKLAAEGFQRDTDVDVFFAGKLSKQFNLHPAMAHLGEKPFHLGTKPVAIVHYNLFVHFETPATSEQACLQDEPVLRRLLAHADSYQIYLCYAPDDVLERRIRTRRVVEPELAPTARPYASDRVLQSLARLDQRQLLLDFGAAFEGRCATMEVVFSADNHAALLPWSDFVSGAPSERLEAAVSERQGGQVPVSDVFGGDD